jgi:hypothetical protein
MVNWRVVLMMISWKHSFTRLQEESEIIAKKKQALDDLLSLGKISQSTYDVFNMEIDQALAEIEAQQKALLGKMNMKMLQLADQIKMLEMLVANFEIQHVTGEVEDEDYLRETGLLSIGLEKARSELDAITGTANQLSSGDVSTHEEPEVSEPEVEFLDEAKPVENEESQPPVEPVAETMQCKEESQPTESEAEVEEKQET